MIQSDTATEDRERDKLRRLVERHKGNRSEIARALSDKGASITRQGVGKQLVRLGLVELADELSAKANKPGPRRVTTEARKLEREALLDALASVPTRDEAAAPLGISVPTLYRRIKDQKITSVQIERRRKQFARRAK